MAVVGPPPKGYTTPESVVAALGRALTAEELAAFPLDLAAIEAVIDGACGRAWDGGPVLDEVCRLDGGRVKLRTFPVASIEAMRVVTALGGAPPRVLTPGTDYGLLDPTLGIVSLGGWAPGSGGGGRCRGTPGTLRADYTPVALIPPYVEHAARDGLAAYYAQGGASAGAIPGAAGPVVGVRKTAGDLTLDTRYAAPASGGGGGGSGVARLPYVMRRWLEWAEWLVFA